MAIKIKSVRSNKPAQQASVTRAANIEKTIIRKPEASVHFSAQNECFKNILWSREEVTHKPHTGIGVCLGFGNSLFLVSYINRSTMWFETLPISLF